MDDPYQELAWSLLASHGFSAPGQPWRMSHWPPGSPLFLASVFGVTNGSALVALLANVAFGSLSLVLLFAIANRLCGLRLALLAPALYAVDWLSIGYVTRVSSGTLGAAVVLAVHYLWLRRMQVNAPQSPGTACAHGVEIHLPTVWPATCRVWCAQWERRNLSRGPCGAYTKLGLPQRGIRGFTKALSHIALWQQVQLTRTRRLGSPLRNAHGQHRRLLGSVAAAYLAVFLLCECLLAGAAAPLHRPREITVVFRYDDYSNFSSTVLEAELLEAFRRHDLPCTFAVVPFTLPGRPEGSPGETAMPLSPSKAALLRDGITAGVLEVALHGHTHTPRPFRPCESNRYTEFAGLPYDDQVRKIAAGKDCLEQALNTPISVFVPPWNTYDSNTVHAVEALNFESISSGRLGQADVSSSLKFLPATCDLPHLREAVETARRLSCEEPVIVVVLHQFDFLEFDSRRGQFTLQDLDQVLNWAASQEDVHVRSIQEAASTIRDLSARRFSCWQGYARLSIMMPPFLRPGAARIYLSTETACRLLPRLHASVVGFYLAGLLASVAIVCLVGRMVSPTLRRVITLVRYAGPACTVLFFVYAVLQGWLGWWRSALAMNALLGASIGAWSCFPKSKQDRRLK